MSEDATKALGAALPRRRLLRAATAVMAASMVASHSRASRAQQAPLRWSTISFGPEALTLWQKLAARAEGQLPGTRISVEGTPFNDYWTKLQTQLASGGSADLLQMQSLRFSQYASRGVSGHSTHLVLMALASMLLTSTRLSATPSNITVTCKCCRSTSAVS